jgi:hypothetical protein
MKFITKRKESSNRKKENYKTHWIECYDDIYLPIAFVLLIAFILGAIGTKYNQGYQIPSNSIMIIKSM